MFSQQMYELLLLRLVSNLCTEICTIKHRCQRKFRAMMRHSEISYGCFAMQQKSQSKIYSIWIVNRSNLCKQPPQIWYSVCTWILMKMILKHRNSSARSVVDSIIARLLGLRAANKQPPFLSDKRIGREQCDYWRHPLAGCAIRFNRNTFIYIWWNIFKFKSTENRYFTWKYLKESTYWNGLCIDIKFSCTKRKVAFIQPAEDPSVIDIFRKWIWAMPMWDSHLMQSKWVVNLQTLHFVCTAP